LGEEREAISERLKKSILALKEERKQEMEKRKNQVRAEIQEIRAQ